MQPVTWFVATTVDEDYLSVDEDYLCGGLVATTVDEVATVDEDYLSVVVWLQPRWMKTICQWLVVCNHG